MNKKSETVQLTLNKSRVTNSGLKIEYVGNSMDSVQPFSDRPEISTPSSSLMKYSLRLSHGKESKNIVLSCGFGMVSNEVEIFHNFRISYVDTKSLNGQTSLILRIEKINSPP